MNPALKHLLEASALIVCLIACSPAGQASDGSIVLNGRLNTPVMSLHGGVAYLQLTVSTPEATIRDRRPLNLSIVLDRSGSMGDEMKIDYAKRAINTLIDQLNSEDILSIVIYDDVVQILRESQRVGSDKYAIKRLVERVEPRGSTNLGGGMVQGLREVERRYRSDYVNRVILLSDGLANQGITDPNELDRIARRYRAKCISLTTMGVGLDYNENLMVGLSENGGGNYYFIENPNTMASIMNKEFHMISTLAARNASIELTFGENVVVRDILGCDQRLQNGHYSIPVGDLYSGEQREFTVELGIPAGSGTFTVAQGNLGYESDHHTFDESPGFACTVRYTRDLALIDKERDIDAQAKADIAISTRTVDKAMQALDDGKTEEAARYLHAAQGAISASPAVSASGAGGAALRAQAAKLGSYEQMVKDSTGDTRKAKKSIQYENYKTQRSKE